MDSKGEGPLDHLNRHRGCLLGLATGDALGTTLEFRAPGTFEPIGDMSMARQTYGLESGW